MKHSSASRWVGRALYTAAALAVPTSIAFGADDGLTAICYQGSEARVSQNVLPDYLADGAKLGSCSQVQAQAAASSSSSSSIAPAAQANEDSSLAVDLPALDSLPFWMHEEPQTEAAPAQESENTGGSNRMTLNISTNLNGERTERRQVWEDGELVTDTVNGVGLNVGFPFGSFGLGF